MVKNCDLGLENAALGLRPRAVFSRPRSQFFTIRTSQPANNIYLSHRKGKSLKYILIKAEFSGQRFKSASEWQESHRPINTF